MSTHSVSEKGHLRPSVLHLTFPNFAKLPSGINRVVESDVYTDQYANKWQLELFPGGFYPGDAALQPEGERMIVFCLCLCDTQNADNSVNASVSISLRNAEGGVAKEIIWHMDKGSDFVFKKNSPIGGHFGMKRSAILDGSNNILVNDALHIDVFIQLVKHPERKLPIPNGNPLHSNMMSLFESGNVSDVTFQTKGQMFNAHKTIIYANAPALAELFDGKTGNSGCTIKIHKMKPKVFHHVLRYIYGSSLVCDRKFLESNGVRMLEAAERFGMADLKEEVEKALVSYRVIDLKNAAEMILLAYSLNCSCLKDYAIEYFLARPEDVLNSEYSNKRHELISSHIFQELLIAVQREKQSNSCEKSICRRTSVESISSVSSSVAELTLSCLGKTYEFISNSASDAVVKYLRVDNSCSETTCSDIIAGLNE